MITRIDGQLEIDHKRGVIYFHGGEVCIRKHGIMTVLRICRLPTPIPKIKKSGMLELGLPRSCSWKGIASGFES